MPGHTKISDSEYDSFHFFLLNLLRYFNIGGEDGVKFGYIIFGQNPVSAASINNFRNQIESEHAIANLVRSHITNRLGSTQNISALLDEIREEFNAANRRDVPKIAIILSDDALRSSEVAHVRNTVLRMYEEGILVTVVQRKFKYDQEDMKTSIPTKICRTIFVDSLNIGPGSRFSDIWRIICGGKIFPLFVKQC